MAAGALEIINSGIIKILMRSQRNFIFWNRSCEFLLAFLRNLHISHLRLIFTDNRFLRDVYH